MAVRDRVAELIQRSGLKQKAVADLLGEPEYWLSNRIVGRTAIRADELPKLAQALGVSSCSLLCEDEQPLHRPQETRTSEQAASYLDADEIAKALAARALAMSEREIQLLVDFMEFQRTRE